MEEPTPTVPSAKMVDTLASYISNHKFQFKFNLNIENCKFQRKIINVFLVLYCMQIIVLYIQYRFMYCMFFNVKFYTRLTVLRWS